MGREVCEEGGTGEEAAGVGGDGIWQGAGVCGVGEE